MADEMIIFTKTFDFLAWLLERTESFPRSQRFVVTQRLHNAALDFHECIVEANARHGSSRLARLRAADEALVKLRHYLRLVTRLGWLTGRQYQHAAGLAAELGRLLGGWIKSVDGKR